MGLASSAFDPNTKLPGWDAHSYGYHSDDGGLFHDCGYKVGEFPSVTGFGPGDTVGCGYNYIARSIFFTLNGTFLGTAFQDVDLSLHKDGCLYPTVGMDSTCEIQFNFGQTPFQFNLVRYLSFTENIDLPTADNTSTSAEYDIKAVSIY